MFAKEGFKFIIPLLIWVILVVIITLIFPVIQLIYLSVLSSLLFLFVLWFFRDPERTPHPDINKIVSPADGRIVAFDEIHNKYVGNAKVLSIFMSVFDVHVNRMPADGEIVDEFYTEGKFMSAYNPAASFENERRTLYIDSGGDRRYVVTQIAGMVARRIVPYLVKGDKGKKGDKLGMICFGSKVDIIMPESIVLEVKLNQKLKAGKTVLGTFK
ncbi:MAG: phosphatidylserine decarboxylase family protein [Fidelibacterota bacterium]